MRREKGNGYGKRKQFSSFIIGKQRERERKKKSAREKERERDKFREKERGKKGTCLIRTPLNKIVEPHHEEGKKKLLRRTFATFLTDGSFFFLFSLSFFFFLSIFFHSEKGEKMREKAVEKEREKKMTEKE